METLFYFLIWAVIIFAMMRWGCGAHVMGHGSSHGHGRDGVTGNRVPGTPQGKVADPVCGMIVETAKAKSAIHDGKAYYFCSHLCREKFESSPSSYVESWATPRMMGKEHEL